MNRQTPYGTPMGSRERTQSFQGFIRPSGQFSLHQNSPFSGSPRGGNDFSEFIPLEYSSPVKNRGRGSSGHWRGGGSNRSSYSNSPANSGYNSSCSPYNSNRSHNFSRKYRGNHGNGNRSSNSDISLFYHHSMVEDPWAELELELQQLMPDQSKSLSSKNPETIDPPLLSDSDEGVDSQENESFVSSSEGSS